MNSWLWVLYILVERKEERKMEREWWRHGFCSYY